MSRTERLRPAPVGLNAEWYERAARTGVVHLQRCDGCGRWRHPPRHRCAACGGHTWSWQPVSGRATVFTWTLTHRALDPAFADELPYAVVVAELEEGPRLVGNLAPGDDPSSLELGLPVRVGVEQLDDAVGLVELHLAQATRNRSGSR